MVSLSAEVGRIVVSEAGRDKGSVFIIIEIVDDKNVLIADGDIRRLAAPKKKKIKHLSLKAEVLEIIALKLKEGKKVFDAELRNAIKSSDFMAGKEKGE